MNLPNKLTILRIILVPFFVLFMLLSGDIFPHHNLVALAIFGIASYTDHLDGKIARRDHLITNFGKLMDPLADKIMVMSALVCFVANGMTNTVFVLLIMVREFAVTSIRLIAVEQGRVIPANNWGKAKTVSQIVAICIVLLTQYILDLGAYGILALPDGDAFSDIYMGEFCRDGDCNLARRCFRHHLRQRRKRFIYRAVI